MKTIELDASQWHTAGAYLHAMKDAIQAPEGHGSSIDAFLDSMVWGDFNGLEPPYVIRIFNLNNASPLISNEVELLKSALEQARSEYRKRKGKDVDVSIEIVHYAS